MEKTARCSGQCCTGFVLSNGGDKYHRTWIDTWLEEDVSGKKKLRAEVRRILQMVIPLYDSEDGQYTTFTCKNYNTETGNCTIYAKRPQMCKDFPGDNACTFDGCTLRR